MTQKSCNFENSKNVTQNYTCIRCGTRNNILLTNVLPLNLNVICAQELDTFQKCAKVNLNRPSQRVLTT